MSTPNEPQDPTQAYPPAQPTQPYGQQPPAAPYPPQQPTQAYPPAQPTEAYPPQGGYPGQPAYGQPGAYGQPPAGPDTRPKKLGWIALGLGIAAVVVMGISWGTAFLAGIGVAVSALALLLGLAAIIFGIVVLVNKAAGFKVGGILGIVGGVIAGLAWFSLIAAIAIFGLYQSGSSQSGSDPAPTSSESSQASEDPEPSDEAEEPAGAYDPDAYIAEVRPQIEELMAEVDPMFTPDLVASTYTDETLVDFGEQFAAMGSLENMEVGRDAFVSAVVSSSGELFNEDQANRFFDIITQGAAAHLMQ